MKIMKLIDMLAFSSSSGRKVELRCLRTVGFFWGLRIAFAIYYTQKFTFTVSCTSRIEFYIMISRVSPLMLVNCFSCYFHYFCEAIV